MLNSKLIRLLRTLNTEEAEGLKVFLASPFFNTNKSIIKLYDTLFEVYPDFEDHKMSKVHLFHQIYPKKTYQDGSFRNLLMELTKLTQEYFKQLELKGRCSLQDRLLLDAYAKRSLQKDLDKHFGKMMTAFDKNTIESGTQFLEEYLTLKNYYHARETQRENLESDFFFQMLDKLNNFFVASKLHLIIIIASQSNLLKGIVPIFHFKKSIVAYLSNYSTQTSPLLNIFKALELSYSEPTQLKIHVDSATDLFKTNYQRFTPFDQEFIIMIILNQMSFSLLLGYKQYLIEKYKLYQFGLNNNIFRFESGIANVIFNDIVTAASRNDRTEWALNFIEEHEQYLPLAEREISVAVAKAIVAHDLGDYDKVAELSREYSFRKSKLGLRFRFMSIKANLEIARRDPSHFTYTYNFIQRMRQYVQRNTEKRKEDQVVGFINFLNIVKLILNQYQEKNQAGIKEIELIIKKQKPIIAKNWLLQKVADLE